MRIPGIRRKLAILLLTPATLLLLKGCDGVGDITGEEHGDEEQITVTLQNLDPPGIGLAVHLFGPGETFPNGRLEPGATRTLIYDVRPNGQVEFRAGRLGSILVTKSCKCTSACDPNHSGAARVEWDGDALACVGW